MPLASLGFAPRIPVPGLHPLAIARHGLRRRPSLSACIRLLPSLRAILLPKLLRALLLPWPFLLPALLLPWPFLPLRGLPLLRRALLPRPFTAT
ncbi:MAG TPA: hypothetical protein VFU55_09165 [Terracidiphilus sp.]|nr:hypothetical protein [Terracidiphilus sp.]